MARGDPSNQGGAFNPKEGWQPNDRPYMMNIPAGGRFPPQPQNQPQSPHPRPQSIKAALRDCVRVPVKEFALIAVCENGDLQTFASPTLSKYHDKIFSDSFKSSFNRAMRRAAAEESFGVTAYGQDAGMYNNFEIDTGNERQSGGSSDSSRRLHRKTRSEDSDEEGSGSSRRVRRRFGGRGRDNSSDNNTLKPIPSRKTQELEIGDSARVEEFYLNRFKDMQQTACKIMGKAFVKLVEPRKQTHHPYTRGDESAPPWWPANKELGEFYVRHKEPDHLYKKERIRLLVTILRMIVQPHAKQHSSVQKVSLTVRKLEEVTNEAMSIWFGDTEHPENKNKKVYLKEIFRVAKLEERYLNGEVDHDAKVPVLFGDRSKAEDESEDEGLQYDTPQEGEDEDTEPSGMVASIPTPESIPLVSPPMSQHQQLHLTENDSMRMRQIPHRYNTHSIEKQHTFAEPAGYFTRNVEPFQQSPTMSDPVRRSYTTQDYHSNSQHNGLGWQPQTMVSNGSQNAPYYTQASLPPSASIYQVATLPPPHTMITPNLGPLFESLPSRYDPSIGTVPGAQFRNGTLGHTHHMSSHGFEGYLQNSESHFAHSPEEMKEEQQQQQQQHHHMQHPG